MKNGRSKTVPNTADTVDQVIFHIQYNSVHTCFFVSNIIDELMIENGVNFVVMLNEIDLLIRRTFNHSVTNENYYMHSLAF